MFTLRWLFPAVVLLMIASGLWTGCSTSPSIAVTLHPPYFTSRDRFLQYRLPAGWFDATADSQSSGQAIWLLRNDYTATIAVSEVHVDPDAREDLQNAGLTHLARLTMGLAAGGKAYVLEHPPEWMTVNNIRGCMYQISIPPANDILRIIVVEMGVRVYMVTALLSGEVKQGLREEIFAVQDAFLGGLRW